MLRTLLACTILGISSPTLFAQNSAPDTAFLSSSIKYATTLYTKAVFNQSHLLNGIDYIDYMPLEDEHPFFGSDDWVVGDVYYDGQLFENAALLYDIQKDVLVTEYIHNGGMMQLISEKVKYFTFHGHQFIRIAPAREYAGVEPGYYELLYDGNVKVYSKHKKVFQERIVSQHFEREFDYKVRVYIFKDGQYFSVDKKSGVLSVFGDKKQALRALLKKNKVRFGKDKVNGIVAAARLYDSIN